MIAIQFPKRMTFSQPKKSTRIRRRWLITACAVSFYGLLWGITAIWGSAQVEDAFIRRERQRLLAKEVLFEISNIPDVATAATCHEPTAWISTSALGPFVVRVDYALVDIGTGGVATSYYELWLFGWHTSIGGRDLWAFEAFDGEIYMMPTDSSP